LIWDLVIYLFYKVDSWKDPRFPTSILFCLILVQGLMRRGLKIETLKKFVHSQGGSKSIAFVIYL
jgi:hypothetical protein